MRMVLLGLGFSAASGCAALGRLNRGTRGRNSGIELGGVAASMAALAVVIGADMRTTGLRVLLGGMGLAGGIGVLPIA